MIVKSPCRQIQGESGTALLASVLLISLITGAGLTALAMTSVSLNIASNLLPSKQAFYLAEAGIQHGKSFLSQNRNNWTTYASAQAQTLLPYTDRKSTRLNSSHLVISYAVFCLKKKKKEGYCRNNNDQLFVLP